MQGLSLPIKVSEHVGVLRYAILCNYGLMLTTISTQKATRSHHKGSSKTTNLQRLKTSTYIISGLDVIGTVTLPVNPRPLGGCLHATYYANAIFIFWNLAEVEDDEDSDQNADDVDGGDTTEDED